MILDGNLHGTIVNIQHFSVDDGPGIRTTVFLKGCPLRCAWCHNPETHVGATELMYRSDKCRMCGACQVACTQGLHRVADIDGEHFFERDGCLACGRCSEVCVFGALELVGWQMSVEDVVSEILPDSHFCKLSGGGVTISGGEPLAQADFTEALLLACKENSLHTCVETCGYGDTEKLLRISKNTDLFLYDYKLTDADLHEEYTGVSNERILANLDALCQSGAEVILRCPIIPGVNQCESHYDGIAALVNRYPLNIKEIHLEPYHPMGVSKAESIGKPSAYERKEFLERAELEPVAEYIQAKVEAASVKVS